MKYIFGIFLALFVVSGSYAMTATVKEIVDGDTFMATTSDGVVRVSLINADTPELQGQCESEVELAREAKDHLIELIPEGSRVEVKAVIRDFFNSKIRGTVILSDGRDLGNVLIKENIARPTASKGTINNWCK